MPTQRILHIDATAGASGDMILGALVDLGVPLTRLRAALATLPVRGWRMSSRRIVRAGMAVRRVDVTLTQPQPARDWRDLRKILLAGRLPAEVRDRALSIFRRLIEAEAEVHDVPFERVHLHEAGAVDAIVDVVGASVGLAELGADRIVVSAMTTGFGSVVCDHGVYPVPAPATALLIRGVPVQGGDLEGERLTPTGAAILTTIADAWGPLPGMRPERVGYGAGSREFPGTPNAVRMTIGTAEARATEADARESKVDARESKSATREVGTEIVVIEVTLDDATPQVLAFATERLFEAGALDVTSSAVVMKKGRSGHHLTVLGRPEDLDALTSVVFRETTTLGLRFRRESRIELARELQTIRTRVGKVRVKVGSLDGRPIQAWPEYEDCAAIARAKRLPLREVQQEALDAYRVLSAAPPKRTRKGAPR